MRSTFQLFFVAVVGLWLHSTTTADAYPRACDDLCDENAHCNTACYPTELDFINDTEITCLDYYGMCDFSTCGESCNGGNGTPGSGSGTGITCGDSVCDGPETCDNCPNDCSPQENTCGTCGDNVCAANEFGGAGSGFSPQCSAYATWCDYCENDCGACSDGACWPQVCGGESERYQCRSCSSDNECGYYGGAWCATGWNRDKLCHTYCWDDYECPSPKVCNVQQNECVDPGLLS